MEIGVSDPTKELVLIAAANRIFTGLQEMEDEVDHEDGDEHVQNG